MGYGEGLGFFAGMIGEGAGEDEGQAGEARIDQGLALFFHVYADFAQMVDEFAVSGFGKEFADAFGDLVADFPDFH